MQRFLGFGRKHVENYSKKTGNVVFLHLKRTRKPLSSSDPAGCPAEKVSRLAIGVDGGFNPDAKRYDYDESNTLVVMPGFITLSLENPDVPLAVQMSATGILSAESATKKRELSDAAGTWDGEKVSVSKYADNLEQLDNGVKVPPKGWKCERCDLTNNLWLNLTSGKIFCGRKFFDGSGGNNHAVDYYQETKYPLVSNG